MQYRDLSRLQLFGYPLKTLFKSVLNNKQQTLFRMQFVKYLSLDYSSEKDWADFIIIK